MELEQIRRLRDEAMRLEGEARAISVELHRLEEVRSDLRRRYWEALEELQRIVADMADAEDEAGSEWPHTGCAWCGGALPAAARPGDVCPGCVARHGIEHVDHLPQMTREETTRSPTGSCRWTGRGRWWGTTAPRRR